MYLPKPPTIKEKYLYLNQNKPLLYGGGVVSLVLLFSGMVLFSTTHWGFWWFLIYAVLVFTYLTISYFIGIFGKSFDYISYSLDVAMYYVPFKTVDIFLPVCNEPIDILENTWRYVSEITYPKNLLSIYVLDDGNNPEVEKLAKEFGFHYIVRPDRPYLKKAGNMRHAFKYSSGEFILILDADFCPSSDILISMIPCFKKDVAIVQSPQFFTIESEQTWIEKGAAFIQELFYRVIQVNRNTWGASVCVGTCAMYRRKALEPFGGTAPIGYSEDLHTGFQVLSAGWKIKYIPINLSKGVCPDTLSSFFVQQYRWAMGSTTLLFSKHFWQTKLPLMTRLCYVSGMFYYSATAISIFISVLPAILIVWFFPDHVLWYNWLFVIPSFIYGTLFLSLWSKFPFGLYVLKARLISYYAHFFAIKDKLFDTKMEWIPTGDPRAKKQTKYQSFRNLLYTWSNISFILAMTGAFYRMGQVAEYGLWYNFIPLIFFSAFNYYIASSILKD